MTEILQAFQKARDVLPPRWHMVGRAYELSLLKDAFDAAETDPTASCTLWSTCIIHTSEFAIQGKVLIYTEEKRPFPELPKINIVAVVTVPLEEKL